MYYCSQFHNANDTRTADPAGFSRSFFIDSCNSKLDFSFPFALSSGSGHVMLTLVKKPTGNRQVRDLPAVPLQTRIQCFSYPHTYPTLYILIIFFPQITCLVALTQTEPILGDLTKAKPGSTRYMEATIYITAWQALAGVAKVGRAILI